MITCYPRGRSEDHTHLSVYVEAVDFADKLKGWKVPCTFTMTIVNQADPRQPFRQGFSFEKACSNLHQA